MAKLTIQKLDFNKNNVGKPFQVQFNPTEYAFNKAAQYAEVAIPGLDAPVIQFVRGETEQLSLELFFDTTNDGTGFKVSSVNEKVNPFYRLVKVDGASHAPPILRLTWGTEFPGSTTDKGLKPKTVFDCVVVSVDRKYTLFNPEGIPLRATVALALKEYKTLEEQLQELNLQSSDHTRVHIVRQGETTTPNCI